MNLLIAATEKSGDMNMAEAILGLGLIAGFCFFMWLIMRD